MTVDVFRLTEQWAGPDGPLSHVVVSSRVRHARNLDRLAFPPHAGKDDLRRVCDSVDRLVRGNASLSSFTRLDLQAFSSLQRTFLKESHIISPELEQAGEFRVLYVDPARSCAVMVNEEDHLRMYCLRAGFQIIPVLESINAIDAAFGQSLHYAFSEKYGFLTTCPSNVGTGMRASVMLHLPGLAMTHQIEELLKNLPKSGLAVRGYYGENSEFLGDFYQVSNEVTLGKMEDQIVQSLQSVIEHLVAKEEAARNILFEKKRWYADDVIWRAYAVLTHARIMASSEAFKLLSPIRLGIERGYFPTLNHHRLNQMIVAVQPAHLQMAEGREISVEDRDIARAQLLRKAFTSLETRQ